MSIMSETVSSAPAGWYADPLRSDGVLRYWDGTQWTQHWHDPRAVVPSPQPVPHVVVHQDRGKPVNHVLHAILSLVTFGLWLPVWLIVAIAKN